MVTLTGESLLKYPSHSITNITLQQTVPSTFHVALVILNQILYRQVQHVLKLVQKAEIMPTFLL